MKTKTKTEAPSDGDGDEQHQAHTFEATDILSPGFAPYYKA